MTSLSEITADAAFNAWLYRFGMIQYIADQFEFDLDDAHHAARIPEVRRGFFLER